MTDKTEIEERKTDPYGHLEYAVGTGDDFICFDFCVDRERGVVTLHSVVNSETRSYIEDFEAPFEMPLSEAYGAARAMVDSAVEWVAEANLEHDPLGWNQDPCYFARAVKSAIDGEGQALRNNASWAADYIVYDKEGNFEYITAATLADLGEFPYDNYELACCQHESE